MNIEAFMLCDAATDQQGKLNVLGAFDAIHTQKFPSVHMACAVAIRIRFTSLEKGDHNFALCLIDEDGKELIPPLRGNIHVGIPNNQSTGVINLILNMQQLKFDHKGEYSFSLDLDGNELGQIPLFVKYA